MTSPIPSVILGAAGAGIEDRVFHHVTRDPNAPRYALRLLTPRVFAAPNLHWTEDVFSAQLFLSYEALQDEAAHRGLSSSEYAIDQVWA